MNRDITKYFCPRCGSEISYSEVSDGYFGVCNECDEDFYEIELKKVFYLT